MNPARILFVNHVSRVSGAERSLLDLVRHLDRTRFEPVVALPSGGELAASLRDCNVICHPLPLRRLRKTLNPARLFGYLIHVSSVSNQLARLIRRERIALVHANSNTAQLYAGPAARKCGIPCIWHTRDLVQLGPLGWWLDRFASQTIAISDCVRQQVEPSTRHPERWQTIHNGIDLDSFVSHHDRDRTRAEPGLSPAAPVLGMIAQLVPWKGHHAFIAMAARLAASLPEARFVVAGDDLFQDHPGYRAALEAQAADLGIRDRLLFPGYQPDIARLLDSLDIVVHPATREPLGRVILEAMAMGKPVVAVNACGPAEIIHHGVDGLLTASDRAEDLADAALTVIRDPALARRIGDAARRRIEQDFNIRQTVRKIEALYTTLLGQRDLACA